MSYRKVERGWYFKVKNLGRFLVALWDAARYRWDEVPDDR